MSQAVNIFRILEHRRARLRIAFTPAVPDRRLTRRYSLISSAWIACFIILGSVVACGIVWLPASASDGLVTLCALAFLGAGFALFKAWKNLKLARSQAFPQGHQIVVNPRRFTMILGRGLWAIRSSIKLRQIRYVQSFAATCPTATHANPSFGVYIAAWSLQVQIIAIDLSQSSSEELAGLTHKTITKHLIHAGVAEEHLPTLGTIENEEEHQISQANRPPPKSKAHTRYSEDGDFIVEIPCRRLTFKTHDLATAAIVLAWLVTPMVWAGFLLNWLGHWGLSFLGPASIVFTSLSIYLFFRFTFFSNNLRITIDRSHLTVIWQGKKQQKHLAYELIDVTTLDVDYDANQAPRIMIELEKPYRKELLLAPDSLEEATWLTATLKYNAGIDSRK